MLGKARIGACVPVSDLERAIEFYGQTLGLGTPERDDMPENPGARFPIGGGELYVYKSVGAGQSRHTLCAFEVENIEQEVKDLRGNGVTFEEYDMPGMKTEDGVMHMGPASRAPSSRIPTGTSSAWASAPGSARQRLGRAFERRRSGAGRRRRRSGRPRAGGFWATPVGGACTRCSTLRTAILRPATRPQRRSAC